MPELRYVTGRFQVVGMRVLYHTLERRGNWLIVCCGSTAGQQPDTYPSPSSKRQIDAT
jgi:hypothetical protein